MLDKLKKLKNPYIYEIKNGNGLFFRVSHQDGKDHREFSISQKQFNEIKNELIQDIDLQYTKGYKIKEVIYN